MDNVEAGRQLDVERPAQPQHTGSKETGDCWRWIRLQQGRWVSEGPTKFTCSGVTKADDMGTWLSFTILGIFTGAAYAIAASGLVLTYARPVFNVATAPSAW